MKKFFILSLSIMMISSMVQADAIRDYLDQVEAAFDAALTDQERFELISKPLNKKYLWKLNNISDLDEAALTENVGPKVFEVTVPTKTTGHNYDSCVKTKEVFNYDRTNALAIAIALGDVYLVQKFLTVIDDINDIRLVSWGYRQPYSVAHQVLDPTVFFDADVPHEHKIALIDLVAAKGADFNHSFPHPYVGIYNNPPLAAGDLRGGTYDRFQELRALGMLYGGEHILKGSSYAGTHMLSEYNRDTKQALLDHFIIRKKAGIHMRPTKAVMAILQEFAQNSGVDLAAITEEEHHLNFIDRLVLMGCAQQELSAYEAELSHIDAKLDKNAARIVEVKRCKTKKQKRYLRHLEDIQQELQSQYAQMDKKLKKLKVQLDRVEF